MPTKLPQNSRGCGPVRGNRRKAEGDDLRKAVLTNPLRKQSDLVPLETGRELTGQSSTSAADSETKQDLNFPRPGPSAPGKTLLANLHGKPPSGSRKSISADNVSDGNYRKALDLSISKQKNDKTQLHETEPPPTIIIVKQCENKKCVTNEVCIKGTTDINTVVEQLYHNDRYDKYFPDNRGSKGSIPNASYLYGKQLVDCLVTSDEKHGYREKEEAEVRIDRDREHDRLDLVNRLSSRCAFYKNIDAQNLLKSERMMHGGISLKTYRDVMADLETCDDRHKKFTIDEVYKILGESRPYINKALNNLEEIKKAEEKAVCFEANMADQPVTGEGLALINYIRKTSTLKEIKNITNCMGNAEKVLANISMLKTIIKNLRKMDTCESKSFMKLESNLDTLNETTNDIINHIAFFPEHLKNLIVAMGYVPDHSSDQLISDRRHVLNFSNISGREFDYLINQEKSAQSKRCGTERKVRLRLISEYVYDQNNCAEKRKSLLDSITLRR